VVALPGDHLYCSETHPEALASAILSFLADSAVVKPAPAKGCVKCLYPGEDLKLGAFRYGSGYTFDISTRPERLEARRTAKCTLGLPCSLAYDLACLPRVIVGLFKGLSEMKKTMATKAEDDGKTDEGLSTNRTLTTASGPVTSEITMRLRDITAQLGYGPDSLAGQVATPGGIPSYMSPFLVDQGYTAGVRNMYFWTGQLPNSHIGPNHAAGISAMQIRTCFLDDVVERFVEDHTAGGGRCNLIVLGARGDSRCYRLPAVLASKVAIDAGGGLVNCYEVDAKAAQDEKIARLDEARIARDHVTFVACDEGSAWLTKLKSVKLNTALPTVVLWEGISMYLDDDVVADFLLSVGGAFKGPLALAFDWMDKASQRFLGPAQKIKNKKIKGEPLTGTWTIEELDAALLKAGLKTVDVVYNNEPSRYMPPSLWRGVTKQAWYQWRVAANDKLAFPAPPAKELV